MKKIKIIKHFTEFLIVYFVSNILNCLPINIVSYFGGIIFKILGPFTKYDVIAKKNYLKIFPSADSKEIKKIISLSWQNLGKTFFELLILPKIFKNSKKIINIDGAEEIIKLGKTNEKFVFIGIHQSNWEIIVPSIDRLGFNVGAVYRHINNPFINKLVLKKRSKSLLNNNSFYTPKGKEGAVEIIKAIKNGYSILVIVDQKDSAGYNIPFFGYEVKTQTRFLKLAKKHNMKIIPVENTRYGLNNFCLKFHKPIKLEINNFDSYKEMKKIHSIIENWIKKNPSNWFYQHNRFG